MSQRTIYISMQKLNLGAEIRRFLYSKEKCATFRFSQIHKVAHYVDPHEIYVHFYLFLKLLSSTALSPIFKKHKLTIVTVDGPRITINRCTRKFPKMNALLYAIKSTWVL